MVAKLRTALALCPLAAAVACSAGPTLSVPAAANDDAGSSVGSASGSSSGSTTSPPGNPTEDAGSASTPAEDGGARAPVTTTDAGMDSATPENLRVVAYLPNYAGSYATWATTIDFTKMTHLNLAFATADSSNGWDMGASDSDVATLVTAAHAKGVQVIASLGGGGGDQTVIAQFQNAANVPTLVANLDTFVAAHDFDGVDIDIEDPNNLGADYTTFVDAVVAKLHPEGKVVTAAVAQYLQSNMADATLHEFDFLNVMIYSDYSDTVSAATYYAQTKNVPSSRLALGAGFFGTDSSGNEYSYSQIMAADPDAWSKNQTQVSGVTVSYTGVASMQQLAAYAQGYGGIMFWDLSQDVTGAHSLYATIQGAM